DVVQRPGGHAPPPTDDVHCKAVVLRVYTHSDSENTDRGAAQPIGLSAISHQRVLDGPHGRVFPGVSEAIIDEGLEGGRIVLRVAPHLSQLGPAWAQAELVVETVDGVAADWRVRVLWHPSAGGDHVGLVVFVNGSAAVTAGVPGLLAVG